MEWTDDMREISGFGGAYEEACREMVRAAVGAMLAIGEPRPVRRDDPDFVKIEAAMMGAVPDCDGAMFCASFIHAAYIWHNGWSAYCAESRRLAALESTHAPSGRGGER